MGKTRRRRPTLPRGTEYFDLAVHMLRENMHDRPMVVLFGAVLDAGLGDLVASWLRPHKVVEDEFLQQPGFLSSFGPRVNMAFALGLVSEDERWDLQAIGRVRNYFAHHLLDAKFSDPEVRGHLEKFRTVHFRRGVKPRQRFRVAVFQLLPRLNERRRHVSTPEGFEAWIDSREEVEWKAVMGRERPKV